MIGAQSFAPIEKQEFFNGLIENIGNSVKVHTVTARENRPKNTVLHYLANDVASWSGGGPDAGETGASFA